MINEKNIYVRKTEMEKESRKNKIFKSICKKGATVGINFMYMYLVDESLRCGFKVSNPLIELYIDGQKNNRLKIRVSTKCKLFSTKNPTEFSEYVKELNKLNKFIGWLSELDISGLPYASEAKDDYFPIGSFDNVFRNSITDKIKKALCEKYGVAFVAIDGIRKKDEIIVVTKDENHAKTHFTAKYDIHFFDLSGNLKNTLSNKFEYGRYESYSDFFVDKVLMPENNNEKARFLMRYEEDDYTTTGIWILENNNSIKKSPLEKEDYDD